MALNYGHLTRAERRLWADAPRLGPDQTDCTVTLHDPDLALLTAIEAAKLLRVDTKTLRRMGVTFIRGGGSKRYYTVALLRAWQAERAVKCQQDDANRSQASNISRGVRVRRTGTSTSRSTVVDFEKALGLRPRKTPPHSPPSAGTNSGER